MNASDRHAAPGDAGDATFDDGESIEVSESEEQLIAEKSEPRLPVIFEIVRRDGAHELRRPATSLWWSGVAAGFPTNKKPAKRQRPRL
ncbi:MAG: hypothetical protein R3E83_15315 [Burkholderiaceae bacterium]